MWDSGCWETNCWASDCWDFGPVGWREVLRFELRLTQEMSWRLQR